MASSGTTGVHGVYVWNQSDWLDLLGITLRASRTLGMEPHLPRTRVAMIGAPNARHMSYRLGASMDAGVFRTLRLTATQPLHELVDALQPVIRFEVSDQLTFAKEPCVCGRAQRVIEVMHGRAADIHDSRTRFSLRGSQSGSPPNCAVTAWPTSRCMYARSTRSRAERAPANSSSSTCWSTGWATPD